MAKLSKMPRAEQWADRICAQLTKSVESIVETGRLLIKAKADLPHGEFGRMFEDGLVPFGQGTAERLMSIAQHPQLSNSAHAPSLPPSWMTLYELTKVPEPALKNALRDGVIKPDMPRKDVAALMPAKRAIEQQAPAWHWLNALDELHTVVENKTKSWPDEGRAMLPALLRKLADAFEREFSDGSGGQGDRGAESSEGEAVEGVSAAVA